MKSFNSSSVCLKCTVEVVQDPVTQRGYYDGKNGESRTDEQFRANAYHTHFKNLTPLTDILFCDMIKDVHIADELHLLFLGVMRKILLIVIEGKYELKLLSKLEISTTLRFAQQIAQWNFSTTTGSKFYEVLGRYRNFKFQSILLYASVVILQITDDVYNHFMLLFCAVHFFRHQSMSINGNMLGSLRISS